MKRIIAPLAAVLVLATPALGWSQSQPSAKSIALCKQYFAEMDMTKTMDSMMASVMPMVINSDPDSASLPDDVKAALISSARESVAAILPRMMDRLAVEYAKVFTEKELQAMVDFYGSPEGRSIVAKMPQATPAASASMQDLMPALQADMYARLCAKTACPANVKARAKALAA